MKIKVELEVDDMYSELNYDTLTWALWQSMKYASVVVHKAEFVGNKGSLKYVNDFLHHSLVNKKGEDDG